MDTFEMLVERLSNLEDKIDRMEAASQYDYRLRVGRLNPHAFDLDARISVHVEILPCRFSPPKVYHVSVQYNNGNGYEVHLLNMISSGKFDEDLQGCDIDSIKANAKLMINDCSEEDEDEDEDDPYEPEITHIMCSEVGLSSRHKYVYDHIEQLLIARWVQTTNEDWQSIDVSHKHSGFWMTPKAVIVENCDPVRCVSAMISLHNALGFPVPKQTHFQVCPVGANGEFLRDLDLITTEYSEAEDSQKAGLRSKLSILGQLFKPFKSQIQKHEFWGMFFLSSLY